ncbi:hypothetical protein [Marinimicrobium alkaliphilum]|uniref:hypothetical protein n=1 Tax=Marinimicrobium alkaliphilum TaxID=2202654 RepID=UPI000DB99445|nr:hypothetical protein [Marinimicrobium alkaliphilum]
MEYDTAKYKVFKFPSPLLIHWVLNPGLAFNEVILGQRIPKITLIDKTSKAPLMERQYVPCPHCHAIHDARLWSGDNAFGHWFGLVCPDCHGKIPCLWNLTSLVFLALTFPLWIWFKLFGERWWVKKELTRLDKASHSRFPEAKSTSWLKMGLSFGALMFVFFSLPGMYLTGTLSFELFAIQAFICLLAGLAFGFFMKLSLGRKMKNND